MSGLTAFKNNPLSNLCCCRFSDWANSADDKMMIFFLYFLENRLWHWCHLSYLPQTVGPSSHEMLKPIFLEKIRNIAIVCRLRLETFLFSPENRLKHFMRICRPVDAIFLIFPGKNKKSSINRTTNWCFFSYFSKKIGSNISCQFCSTVRGK